MANRPSSELVTDRTLQDVQLLNTKGNYNVSDLNRIGQWQVYVMELLNEHGYYVSIAPKTDWTKYDLPRQSQIDKIKEDTITLKNAYYTKHDYDLHIGNTSINYNVANDIEKVFEDIEFLIKSMEQNVVFCGVARMGQPRIWQQRFRRLKTFFAIPFSKFTDIGNDATLQSISSSNDTMENQISQFNNVWGTFLYINDEYNKLDELVGGINDN